MNIIRTSVFGSHLYGTNTEKSDRDFKTIFLPNPRDIILGRGKETVATRRPKGEGEKNYAGEEEMECFTLKQYLKLVSEGQTVSLDILFTPDRYVTKWGKDASLWAIIERNRHRLISKKSGAFVGYCRQQAKKYGIKGSRVAAVRLVLDYLKSIEEAWGSEQASKMKLGFWATGNSFNNGFERDLVGTEFINVVDITQTSGTSLRYLEVCDRKLQYTSSLKDSIKVLQHLFDEYGSRALQAETNQGIDWKALSHAVRIAEQAQELFKTGFVEFPRPNAEFLKQIKLGELPYKQVAELIEQGFEDVETASKLSELPEDVDHEWIENFIEDVYSQLVVNKYK